MIPLPNPAVYCHDLKISCRRKKKSFFAHRRRHGLGDLKEQWRVNSTTGYPSTTSMFKTLLLTSILALSANAHFQLQFPPPRGVFVQDSEPNFCDGYNTPAANRSQFPLTGGFITMNSEHPQWSSEILLSTASNSTSFNNFVPVMPFFQQQGEGVFCVPLDFASTNATGLMDGQNVTIQILFDGGDGPLYQCADLTLSSNFSAPSGVNCTNKISNPPSSFANTTGTSSTTPSSTPQSAAHRTGIFIGGGVSLVFFATGLLLL
ncbi:hypothetical protein BD779DRAFT_1483499 [Infundibulicybe gibba]|nr:hypothetical protein BD779DRAFT_1483499 [Infundibulicybe gibba]